jgi:hypothetical protein
MTADAVAPGRLGAASQPPGIERAWSRTRGSSDVVIGIVVPELQPDHPLTSPVAPDSRVLPVRYGAGPRALDLAHAIEHAVEMGAHILDAGDADLSGHAVRRAVQYAATRNVLVVCGAPSADTTCPDDEPLPNLISVVPVNELPGPAEPGRGDIGAPAANGTACVSGCAALIKALNPGWGYHELREHLLVSGTSRAELAGKCDDGRMLDVAHAVLGPLEIATDARTLQWSSLSDARLSWTLRYKSAYCINAVALYRSHGDEHWRELAYARATSLHMVVPAASLRRSSGTLRIASREANFHSEEVALTIR